MSKDLTKDNLMATAKQKLQEPWKTKDGQVVRLVDVIDALNSGSSILIKDTVFNEKVKDHPALVIAYKKRAEILDLIKARYEMALRALMPTPKLEIPGKKGRRKKCTK